MSFEIADFVISLKPDGVYLTHTPSGSSTEIAPATLAELLTAIRAHLLDG